MTFRDAGIEAVVFDWGGTLSTHATSVRVEELWRPAAAVLAAHISRSSEEIWACLAATEDEFWQRTETHQRAGTLAGIVAEARDRLGVEVPGEVLEAAALAYLDAWEPHIEHDTQAPPTLEAMRSAGLRTAMLSNTHWPREYHERFLERDGLAHLLDARVYTCELDYMKPHPAAFEAALAAVGVSDPSRVVYVGDRPFDDIFGARRAGLRTALRTNPLVPGYDVVPDVEIGGLPELLTHLELDG
ncbi:MAG: HAD family hydrolase [Chloroflexi bacterium]|nr:HAD family hydrolase [Chloroflexota bacterium]